MKVDELDPLSHITDESIKTNFNLKQIIITEVVLFTNFTILLTCYSFQMNYNLGIFYLQTIKVKVLVVVWYV